MTKSHPVRTLLQRAVPSRRLERWLLQLSEYEITPIMPTTIKSQAISKIMAQFPGKDSFCILDEVLGEVHEVAIVDHTNFSWILRFDGSSVTTEGGAGIVLSREGHQAIAMSFKLGFPCSNNAVEYEAYLIGLAIAHEMGIKCLKVIGDSNLIVSQANGNFSLKEPSLAPYRTLAQKLEEKFDALTIEYTHRSEN
jgi:ribonuclease HI